MHPVLQHLIQPTADNSVPTINRLAYNTIQRLEQVIEGLVRENETLKSFLLNEAQPTGEPDDGSIKHSET